jgi:adenylate kinase
MLIAITGTPGTGKSSLARLLRKKGFLVLNDKFFIKKFNLTLYYDKERETKVIDIDKLKKIIKIFKKNIRKPWFFDSHLSHLFEADLIIVLERDLKELKKEYKKRKYNELKIKENLEAEAFKICRIESLELHNPHKVKVFDKYWKAYHFILKKLEKVKS